MSEIDQAPEDLERPQGNGHTGFRWPEIDRRAFLRRSAMTGVAAGSVSTLLAACGSSASSGGSSSSIFGSHPNYKFVFVNHVTTNPFFTPTQYGIADACKLLGCSYQWTGSENSNVSQMVNALNTAVASKADGIAVSLIDLHAFNSPVEKALAAGIPVIAYNADAVGNPRLAYVGQDLKLAGEKMAERILEKVPSGEVALFIATPGSANLQPRIEGAEKVLKAKGITTHAVATGANVSEEQSAIEAFYKSHTGVKGMYSVDGGSTESLAKVMQKLGLQGQGSRGRLRPHRTDAEPDQSGLPRIHDRPAAVHAGVRPCDAAVLLPGLGDADRPVRSEHRAEVRDHRNGRSVPDQVPLRGHDILGGRRQSLK